MEIYKKSIVELSRLLQKKELSSLELTKYFLDRIKSFDSKLNSFISINEETSIEQAKLADKLISNNSESLLTGIPVAHKDLFSTKGILTTCASKMLEKLLPSI